MQLRSWLSLATGLALLTRSPVQAADSYKNHDEVLVVANTVSATKPTLSLHRKVAHSDLRCL